ncbi:MAG TPA: phage tail protein [Pyrinomonadaceae bacterium]|jgi:phage tail-like protein
MKTVTGARATPQLTGASIALTWQNPPATDFTAPVALAGLRIVRRERTYPLDQTDGVVVYGQAAHGGPVISRFVDEDLKPLTTYYYTIFAVDNGATPAFYAADGARAYALATADYALPERLYRLLPAAHRRYDRLAPEELSALPPAVIAALAALPPPLRGRGPLERFFHATAPALDLMRSTAEGLRQLYDVDNAPAQFLPQLAQWLGWEPDRTLPVSAQRNEVKSSPWLYRTVGTPANLRAIVNRYTGWYTQVAEFAQNITRTNLPPQFNVFAIREQPAGWRAPHDASPALGFAEGNDEATGAGTLPATLVSTTAAPFPLRPDMEFAVTAEERLPVAVRLRVGDFANIAAATAPEVAAVLNREFSELSVEARADGRLVLTSHMTGASSALRVEHYNATLVTLEGAPRGRLSTTQEQLPGLASRLRLFYEANDPQAQRTERLALDAFSGEPRPHALLPGETLPPERLRPLLPGAERAARHAYLNPEPQGRIYYKTFRQGQWGESFALPATPGVAQSDPAVVTIIPPANPPQLWAAWLDVHTNAAAPVLGFGLGNHTATGTTIDGVALPAMLVGTERAPFPLAPGQEFCVSINNQPPVVVRFKAADFVVNGAATALEAAQAINAALPAATASATPDGRIQIDTAMTGPNASLRVEATTELRYAVGQLQRPAPARLRGRVAQPFVIKPGTRLVLRGNWVDADGVEFALTDFATPQNVTAAQLASLLNARLTHVAATPLPDNTILLETLGASGDELLELDLAASDAAHGLGFGAANARAAGGWGDAVVWAKSQPVETALMGRNADLAAVVDAAGVVWLFWAQHWDGHWRIVSSRWNGASWTPVTVISEPPGGAREPCAVRDATNRIWLFFSRLETPGTGTDTWTLCRRVFDPATNSWDAEVAITAPPVGGRAADREPAAVRLASNDLRVFFCSDRNGGRDLWALNVTPAANTVSAPAVVTAGAQADQAPAPVLMPDGSLLLLYRSDRSVPLSRAGVHPLPKVNNRVTVPRAVPALPAVLRSTRLNEAGTLRRYAGTTTAVLADIDRNKRRALWGDLLNYTPQRPAGGTPLDNEFYTRGTVGLYLSQTIPDSALSQQMIKRLLPVLERFLPINVRVVVILAPRVDIEFVYGKGVEIGESYEDKYPFIEFYTGMGEDAAAPAPQMNVIMILSNTLGHVSADPANPPSLRRRTFFPPFE